VGSGWLDEEPIDLGHFTFKTLTLKLLGASTDDVREEAITRLNMNPGSYAFKNVEWLGLFSDDPLPIKEGSPFDVIAARMLDRMQYDKGERDMLVMQHEFVAEYPKHREKIISTMIDYGVPHGETSMSRTVGLPAAIAVRLILQDKVKLTGVHRPVMPELYEPILSELEELGIGFAEKVEPLAG